MRRRTGRNIMLKGVFSFYLVFNINIKYSFEDLFIAHVEKVNKITEAGKILRLNVQSIEDCKNKHPV